LWLLCFKEVFVSWFWRYLWMHAYWLWTNSKKFVWQHICMVYRMPESYQSILLNLLQHSAQQIKIWLSFPSELSAGNACYIVIALLPPTFPLLYGLSNRQASPSISVLMLPLGLFIIICDHAVDEYVKLN
jgi:hypothetical protein